MSIKKSLMKMTILAIAVMCLGFTFAGTANAEEPECNHIVYCDDYKLCILCGKNDLEEEEISEKRHPYAYCYDPTKCGVCNEPFKDGEVPEIRHNLDFQEKYVPAGRGHRAVCACGKEMGNDIYRHVVLCTQEDKSKCAVCRAEVGEIAYTHLIQDVHRTSENHWLVCRDCGQQTSPLLDHYSLCTHPDDPCDFCEMKRDECIIKKEFIGMHPIVDQILEEDGKLYHIAKCTECDDVRIRHEGLLYEDFGDDETHAVYCRECEYQFDDEMHGDEVLIDKFEATCTTDGYTGDLVCEDCGHKFEEGTIIKALGHEYKNGVCIRCGQEETPATGDENHMMTWIFVMSAAVVVISGVLLYLRKKTV